MANLNYSFPAINYVFFINKGNNQINNTVTTPSTQYTAITYRNEQWLESAVITNASLTNTYIMNPTFPNSSIFDPGSESVYIMGFDPLVGLANNSTKIIQTNNYRQWPNTFSASILNSSSVGLGANILHDGKQLATAIGASVKYKAETGLVDSPWVNAGSVIPSPATGSSTYYGANYINGKYYFGGEVLNYFGQSAPLVAVSTTSNISGPYTASALSSSVGMVYAIENLNNIPVLISLESTSASSNLYSLIAYSSSTNGSTWSRNVLISNSVFTDFNVIFGGFGVANGYLTTLINSSSLITVNSSVAYTTNGFNWTVQDLYLHVDFLTAVNGRFLASDRTVGAAYISSNGINFYQDTNQEFTFISLANIVF
jgi:hypothetical protein